MLSCLARKIGMTRIFGENGASLPVTVLELEENRVVGMRSEEKNGYSAVQLGCGINKKEKRKFLTSVYGEKKVPRLIREFLIDADSSVKLGDSVGVGNFEGVSFVDVQSTSTGKGFQGVVKRYGMRGGPKTHGSHFHRVPGSIGNCAYPARVFKGKKMPGRMGGNKVTVQNLRLIKIDQENHLLLVRGAVPGKRGGMVVVKRSVKK